MWLDFVVKLIVVISSLAAAVFWFLSAAAPIPDSMDTFIGALQHASRLSARGAIAAGIGAVAVAFQFIREWKD